MPYSSNTDINRRDVLEYFGIAGIAVLAGCTSQSDGDDGGSEEGVFVEALDSDPGTLDIHDAVRVPEIMALSPIHDRLFAINYEQEAIPHLAANYEMNDDATEWVFELQQGVNFHNGNELNADIAHWNFQRCLDQSPNSYQFGPIDSIEVTGDYELTFYYNDPYPNLPQYLSGVSMGFASREAVEGAGDQYGQETVVGTGPLVFEEWSRDDEIVFSKNKEYDFGPDFLPNQGPVQFDKLQIDIVPEPTTRLNELTVGNIHGSEFIATGDVEEVEQHKTTQLERVDDAHPNYLVLNADSEPTVDVLVRRAIAHSVDRNAIITAALSGEAYPIWSVCPPMAKGGMAEETAKEHGYEYNPDRARELFEEAGWTNSSEGETRTKDGEPLELNFFAFTMERYTKIGEVAQQMLNTVGVDINLEILESGSLYDRVDGGEHHILTMALGSGYRAVDTLESGFHSDNYSPDGGNNFSLWQNQEFDELVDEAKSETDENRQHDLLIEAQQLLLDQAPAVPLMGYKKFYAYKNEVDPSEWFQHPWWPDSNRKHLHSLGVRFK